MMSEEGINGARTTSVLGYCLLPMTLLAVLAAVVNLQYVRRACLRAWGHGRIPG